MSHTTVDLRFADSIGRTQVLHAVTLDGCGWHLRAAVDGSTFTKHCSDWQAVERTLGWLRLHSHEHFIEPALDTVAS